MNDTYCDCCQSGDCVCGMGPNLKKHRQMSTQKNEHNPDNLTPEQVGKGFRLLQYGEVIDPMDEMYITRFGNSRWEPTGPNAPGHIIEKAHYAHRRRITPPTDTTGSGMEGDAKCNCADGFIDFDCPLHGSQVGPTPETDAAKVGASWIIASHSNGDFVHAELAEKMERQRDTAIHERTCCHEIWDQILILCGYDPKGGYPGLVGAVEKVIEQRDAAIAQVEALRRDGERLDWLEDRMRTFQRIDVAYWDHDGRRFTTGDRLLVHDMKGRGGEIETLRAAIDSAQRQEAE